MKSILGQSALLFGAQAFGKLVGFFYNIYLAQNLGVSEFGLFSTALAYFYILQSLAEFGFNRYLVREIAKDNSKISLLIYNVNLVRFIFSLCLVLILAVFLLIFDHDTAKNSIIILTTLAIIPQTISQTIDSIFVALRKLQYSAIASVISSLSTALFGIYLVSRFDLVGASLALITGQLCYLISLYLLTHAEKLKLGSRIHYGVIKEALISSSGYGVLAVIGLISFRLDTVILSYTRGNFETGLYSGAYKFFEATAFIPAALALALFPILAKMHQGDISEVRKLFNKSLKATLVLGIISAVGFYFVVPIVIRIFLPKYIESIAAVKILSFAIPFIFIHIPASQVLLSTERYLKPLLILYTALISINLIDYLILISSFGFRGAAWGTVISEFLTFISFILFLEYKVFRDKPKIT